MAAKIKRNDTVQVMAGKDRGRRGDVRQVLPRDGRAIVTGVNMMKKHQRARSPQEPGGIIQSEAPIQIANLAVVCRACDRAVRVGFKVLEDGSKVRVCKHCNETID
ncbi:MAG: 50S ribosomal protein L24 [Chloroflexi bacterium]|nr:50S ribosomal protein L24 [Chloroflexota bacterium]MDA1002583.1 50S ribosomal protein L24 [Chloroflexota bacterium]MQC27654.1 50S ribosomal protein L24 [Chloroflexota bacterium]